MIQEDHEMESALSATGLNPSPEMPSDEGETGTPAPPRPRTYAGAVAGRDESPSDDDDDSRPDEMPGPIKGFDAKKVYLNLNGQVQQDWERRASAAILVHYLDGGYGPGLAENVSIIRNNLIGIYREAFDPEERISPIVIHPTAAAQPLRNRRGAPPYLFFVTNIPLHFREHLIQTAVVEVGSKLRTLFIEAADPIPHDYITTLQNYNMTIETEDY